METVREKRENRKKLEMLVKVIKKIFVEERMRLRCQKQEIVNEEGFYLCNDCPYCEKNGCMETLLADRLIQNGVTIQEWVSVEERLPEESLDSVMGYDEYRERCVFVQYYKGEWILGNHESVKITHWMPLPEPPKGVQE